VLAAHPASGAPQLTYATSEPFPLRLDSKTSLPLSQSLAWSLTHVPSSPYLYISLSRSMTTSLKQLPLDAVFCITLYLELEDINHLGQTCRQLKYVLELENCRVFRRTVEVRWCKRSMCLQQRLTLLTDQLPIYRRSIFSPKRENQVQASLSSHL